MYQPTEQPPLGSHLRTYNEHISILETALYYVYSIAYKQKYFSTMQKYKHDYNNIKCR